jgi:VWFA-related protein
MRLFFASVAVLIVLAVPTGYGAQDAQRPAPVFRANVDLIAVNVVAVDGQGRPVEDLRARDFSVKVDGKPREVVSAELVKAGGTVASAPAPAPPVPGAALVSTNIAPQAGRRVVIAVDQTMVTPGAIVPVLRTAERFVNQLTPADYGALITFPEPGPRTEFTTDKNRILQSMRLVVGQPRKDGGQGFEMSLTEAIDIGDTERLSFNAGASNPAQTLGPTMRRVFQRSGCDGRSYDEVLADADLLKRCVNLLTNESLVTISEARANGAISLKRLEAFLRELIPVEGPKSMVLVSGGIMIEDLSRLEDVARLASAARTSITVIAVEGDESERLVKESPTRATVQDRSLELQALETIADRTGGFFQRAIGRGESAFTRASTELSAWYVVAVERRPGDPDRQRIDVDVKRKGVTTRANHTVVSAASVDAGRPRGDVLSEALSSPIAMTGVPLRISTFKRRDPASGKYQVQIAADIGQPGTPAGEFAIGHVVMDAKGKVLSTQGRQLQLSPPPGVANQPLHFDTVIALDPGSYSLRIGVVDAGGHRGTVVHPLELAPPAAGALATSDLIVGSVSADGEPLRPSIEPHVDDGRVAAFVDLYLNTQDAPELTARLEIAEGESAPTLAAAPLSVSLGAQPSWRVASGAADVNLAPGRYVARVAVRRGNETLAVVSRPFVLEKAAGATLPRTGTTRNIPISRELQARTAAYVGGIVGGLANIVGQEDFVLEKPDRRVTSDFLLVRYPGSNRDFLTFRDVMRVNDAPVAGHDDRLSDLFVKPWNSIRDRAAEITAASQEHVPAILNPIFVLAFLQSDFQPRFALTVNDAGGEWAKDVKAVSFVETARPTLLRAAGGIDIPSRGTAWIEEGTGRILQTELEIPNGKGKTKIVTTFGLDPRLQIVVPQQMRSENPTGRATYTNFRRFRVDTSEAVTPDTPNP